MSKLSKQPRFIKLSEAARVANARQDGYRAGYRGDGGLSPNEGKHNPFNTINRELHDAWEEGRQMGCDDWIPF